MDNEIWKPVPGFETTYKASSFGRIYSLHTYNGMKPGLKKITLNPYRGYMYVDLFQHGYKGKTTSVHRVIAKTFIPNPMNYPCVNHKDGNKLNNHISNLEWCTYKQNMEHAIKNGLVNFVSGEKISKNLKEKDIHKIFSLKADRYTHEQISYILHIPVSTIAHIALHNNWKYIKIDKEIMDKIEKNKHRWSMRYDFCIRCKKDNIPHNAKGLCENCYQWGIRNKKLNSIIKKYETKD